MAKVIKAGFARVVEAEPLPEIQAEAEIQTEIQDEQPERAIVTQKSFEDTEPDLPDEVKRAAERQAYQAAYDDLIIAAQDEVAAMLTDARNEALQLMRETEKSVNELRDQAWEEGYANAVNQAKIQIDQTIGKMNKDAAEAKASFTAERERLLAELEAQMLGVALDVAGRILHRELSDSDEAYISMLKEAISRMPAEDAVTIRLNPDEYTRFFNKKEAKFQTGKGQVTAKLIADPTLNQYDALIESPSGVVDAGADAQMAQMKRNMGL